MRSADDMHPDSPVLDSALLSDRTPCSFFILVPDVNGSKGITVSIKMVYREAGSVVYAQTMLPRCTMLVGGLQCACAQNLSC